MEGWMRYCDARRSANDAIDQAMQALHGSPSRSPHPIHESIPGNDAGDLGLSRPFEIA